MVHFERDERHVQFGAGTAMPDAAIIVNFEDRVSVPLCITTLGEFRRWTHGADFPECGRIDLITDLTA